MQGMARMSKDMDNVIPMYQETHSGKCVNLLASVGEFYLKTRGTPLLGDQAREVLSHALAACALDNDVDQYDTLQDTLKAYPSAERIAVLETLDDLASRYSQVQEGECLQAELFSIPLVITTDHTTPDLELTAVDAIEDSMAQHGLLPGGARVAVLPWLTTAPAHADHPVRRQHLVQVLLNRMKGQKDFGAPTTDLRPIEESVPIEAETVCVRYLTFAVLAQGDEKATQAVIESLWLDGKIKPRAAAWLHDVENLVADQGAYSLVKAAHPASMVEAERIGLQECVRVEVARFVLRAADAPDATPGECALTLSPERADGLQTSMRLCYVHGDQVLHSVRIGLPNKRAEGDFDAVQFAVMSMAGQVAEVLGVGEVRELDL